MSEHLEFLIEEDGSVRPIQASYVRHDPLDRLIEEDGAQAAVRPPGRPPLDPEHTRRHYLAAARLARDHGRRRGRLDPPSLASIAEYVATPDRAIDRGVDPRTVERWVRRFALPVGSALLRELEQADNNPPG